MKLIEAVAAYTAVSAIMDKELPFKSAHSLLISKKMLEPHVEFYKREERRLAMEFGEKGDDGEVISKEGKFTVNGEKAGGYLKKKNELDQIEVMEELVPTKLKAPDRISPVILEALERIFEMEE